jgi:TldD protein
LIGEAKEVMPKISMCGNDLELAPGFCGSISGSVNVTVGERELQNPERESYSGRDQKGESSR